MATKVVRWTCGAAVALGAAAGIASAQEEEAIASRGEPMETLIAERDWALRLRAEVAATEDRADVLDEDPAYRALPSRLWASEARAIHRSRFAAGAWIESWETEQDMDGQRYGGLIDIPMRGTWTARLRLVQWDYDHAGDRRFAYAGAGGFLNPAVYSFTQYRHEAADDAPDSHQVSEYLTWSAHPRLRLGARAAGEHNVEKWESWYAGGFTTLAIVPDWVTLRVEALAGGWVDTRDFTETRAILYQRISDRFVLRPDYRHYRDDDGHETHSMGIKLLMYLTPALDLQVGYRYYTQDDGSDFDTGTLGAGWIF